jgi:RAB6A-GEF complex partner protein 2
MPSNIQVFVRFKEQSVFAGEEVQCVITFKNVATLQAPVFEPKSWPSTARESPAQPQPNKPGDGLKSQNPRLAAIHSHGARKTSQSAHRATASMSIPAKGSPVSRSTSWSASKRPEKHQRSISIISIGSPDAGMDETSGSPFFADSRPTINHSRSASLQVDSGRHDKVDVLNRRTSPAMKDLGSAAGFNQEESQAIDPPTNAPSSSKEHQHNRQPSQAFKFPSPAATSLSAGPVKSQQFDPIEDSFLKNLQTTERAKPDPSSGLTAATRVLAGTSVTESNRSSGEFQSLSNHSQETLASEQASVAPDKHIFPSPMMRQHYRFDSMSKPKSTNEKLLMGYAQVGATFMLDGALVDQTPFEEVKRKGFLGGQGGGGVVGVKTPSNGGGFLGAFSLNSLGESLGGLLGGDSMSSLKEMKNVASSRSIPLLSTPQSLLFVDLTLVPGEEKSFSFRFMLPKGLPASYKGKAIKIVYNLSVGVQGAPGEKAVQAVRRVNLPFKVFSGVNENGEIYGHDLMQPYVILQDVAKTESIVSASAFPKTLKDLPAKSRDEATQDFLNYVDTLLNKSRRRQSSSATLEAPRGLLRGETGSRAREAISQAIFLSNQAAFSDRSPNRFEIARNGKRIGIIVLDRTLHRLGETVTASINLSNAEMPCYSLRCFLESTEKVNPALALRSAASITRMTRRIYRSQSENSLFAKRIVFTPSIPVTATPTFLTSGVNLDWALRFEFVTSKVEENMGEDSQPIGNDLLESVAEDDRGSILAAVETLQCETFEVSIPITVYGEIVVTGTDSEETVGLPI